MLGPDFPKGRSESMNDGLIIMLIGMGVVFAFLILLMGYIQLIVSWGPRRLQQRKETPVQAQQQHRETEDKDEALVAALAVALAGSGGSRLSLVPPTGGTDSDWRLSGRRELMRGPERVESGLRGRGRDR
jgi:sodium pump decarboxylase gamma subunit